MIEDPSEMTGPMFDALERSMTAKAPHLIPVIHAVRNHGVAFLVIPQKAEDLAASLPRCRRPFIALIGDDTDRALGPDQYDPDALAKLIAKTDGVAIVASAPPMEAYACLSALATELRSNAVIIETRPEQEISWTQAVQQAKPDVSILLCGVRTPRQ